MTVRRMDRAPTSSEPYWRDAGLADLVSAFDRARLAGGDAPIAPKIEDLVRLHRLVRERRRFTALEFGVGYSTLILAHAMCMHERDYKAADGNLPLDQHAFQVYAVDANASWIANVERGLPKDLATRVHFQHSTVSASTFGGRLCHMYDALPNVVADFIYIDGPDPRDVKGHVKGLSFSSGNRVPMSGDILLMEPTLLPGAIILVDGRTANARFLAKNLQRRFRIEHFAADDITMFELDEPPLGARDATRLTYQRGKAEVVA